MFFKNNNKIKSQNINHNLMTIHILKSYPQLLECLSIDKSIVLKKNNYVFCNNDIFSEDSISTSDFNDTIPEIPETIQKKNLALLEFRNIIEFMFNYHFL